MEYTQDVAVLQSALYLAEKLCHDNLRSYKRKSCSEAVSVVRDTIADITHGLAQDLTPSQQHHVKLRLAAILVTMVTSADKAEAEQDDWDYFAGIRIALPGFNWEFLIDVLQGCQLVPYLLQILQNIKREDGLDILHDIIGRMEDAPNPEDAEVLATICNYLFLRSNKYIPAGDVNKIIDLGNRIIDCVSKVVIGQNNCSQPIKAFVLVAMINLINSLYSGRSYIYSSKCNGGMEDFTKYMEKFEKMGKKEMEESFQEYIEGNLRAKVTIVELGSIGNKADFMITNITNVIKSLLKSVCASDLLSIVKPVLSVNCSSESHSLTLPFKLIENILKSAVVNLESLCKLQKFGDARPCIQEALKLLKQIREKFNTAVMDSEKKKPYVDKITEAVNVVDNRLEEYEVAFGWLLQQDFSSDRRIVECIEQNAGLLTTVDFLLQMVDKLHQLNTADQHPHRKIKQLVLSTYKGLPAELQNHVMYHILSQFSPEQLFRVDSGQFQHDITVTFNRLVNMQGQMDKALQDVSVLALQSPKQVISKLVSDAIQNSGQTQIYVQLLEGMPTACRMLTPSGVSVLCDILHARLKKTSLSTTEEKNAIKFIQNLMKVHIQHSSSDPEEEALLSTPDFVTVCILPYLSLPQSRDQSSTIPLTLALQFLKVALDTMLNAGSDWLPSAQSLPIMLCLCEMIDNCNALWEEDRVMSNMDSLKEQCVSNLELVVEVLMPQKEKIPAKGVSWLYNTLHQRVEWTTVIHLVSIFQSVNPEKYPLGVPVSLKRVLDLPENGWITFQDPLYDDEILAVVVLAKVSDASLKFVMDTLKATVFRGEKELYQRIVTALAQVLMDSTVSEWVRILTLVKHLFQKGIWSMSSRILIGPVPLLDFTGIRNELGVLHVCRDVLTVLSGSAWTDITTDNPNPMWLHLSKAVVTCVKQLSLLGMTSEDINRDTSRFALCHTFCLLCHLMTSQPIGSVENLFVLSLDVLSSYGNLADLLDESASNDTLLETDRQQRTMLDSAQKCPEAQRTTLLKKLQ